MISRGQVVLVGATSSRKANITCARLVSDARPTRSRPSVAAAHGTVDVGGARERHAGARSRRWRGRSPRRGDRRALVRPPPIQWSRGSRWRWCSWSASSHPVTVLEEVSFHRAVLGHEATGRFVWQNRPSVDLDTPHGTARATLHTAANARAVLALGHGAGGSIDSADLVAATEAAIAKGVIVALIAGQALPHRRPPLGGAHHQLDTAWKAVIEQLPLDGLPLIVGGRSSGARVACRTADETKATAVLCLAFPVHPPGKPEKSRLSELDAVAVPVLVVQGANRPTRSACRPTRTTW